MVAQQDHAFYLQYTIPDEKGCFERNIKRCTIPSIQVSVLMKFADTVLSLQRKPLGGKSRQRR